MPSPVTSSPVYERRRLAHDLLARSADQGGLTVSVEGLAGMGKTVFLREIAEAVRHAGDRPVYFVNADEIEQGEPYGFIERFATAGPFAEWDFIPDPQTQPVPVARECVRRFRASVPGGAVVLIDDAQWIDGESQRVLRYAIPRLRQGNVLLVFGVRTPHEADSFGAVLTELLAGHPVDLVHHLEPLSADEIRVVTTDRLGTAISHRTAERLLEATSGSFLRLDSIVAQLTPEEVGRLHLTWDLPIRGVSAEDNPLLHAFEDLSPAAWATTELVCLAGHEISRADLAAAAELLGEPLHLQEPCAAGVLSESGFGATVVPRHALVAQAVRSTLAPERVRELSRPLATITTGYRSVRHALRGAEAWSEELGKQVEYYVSEALDHGGFDNATGILREALELATETPVRRELLISLALAHIRAKTGYLALDLIDEYEQLSPGALREFIVVVLSVHRVDQEFPYQRVMELLALSSPDPDDRTIAAFLSFMMVIMTMRTADPAPVPMLIGHAKTLFDQAPDDVAELADARLAWMVAPQEYLVLLDCYEMVHSQRMSEMGVVAATLPGLIERIDRMPDGPLKVDALVAVSGAELAVGHLDRGYELARRGGELLERVSQPWAAGTARLILADSLVLRGEYAEALALIHVTEQVAFDSLDVETRPTFAALQALIAAITGHGETVSFVEQARVQHEIAWEGYGTDSVVVAECEIARVNGDPRAVLAASEGPLVDRLSDTRHGFLTYRAHALIDLGEWERAEALVADLASWRGVRWHEYWGDLDGLRARLAQARGEIEEARQYYAASAEHQPAPLPKALIRGHFGEFLLSLGEADDGRRMLRSAVALLERIGAEAYLPRMRRALDAVPGRGQVHRERLLENLTERERQIAGQLAEGRSNNQIAESLVVSVATVRSHVSNVLRKLQLSSRGEVARLLREKDGAED